MADALCPCGKPAEHINADPDSQDWACRLPVRTVDLTHWQHRLLAELLAPEHKDEHLEHRFLGRKVGYGFVWVPNE